jgi:hypothetical protein
MLPDILRIMGEGAGRRQLQSANFILPYLSKSLVAVVPQEPSPNLRRCRRPGYMQI